jgi:Type II secretion system (T2SS), protein K
MRRAILTLLGCALLVPSARAGQVPGSGFVFMEPEGTAAAGTQPVYRPVIDPARLAMLKGWAANDAALWALDTYERAREIAARRDATAQPVQYFVALVPGGETTAVGFSLRTARGIEAHPRAAYVKLGPDEWRFVTTLLHETGHVALAMLAGGREIPRRGIAAIPHTLAALTDRGTAFDEGFAIHLETLVAHVSAAPEVRRWYRHDRFLFGSAAGLRGEYFVHAADPLSFAQTTARYGDVRDNAFAFVSAQKGPDYVRAQVEVGRDFSQLRDADQLLQSEGFAASFFFSVLVRGETPSTRDVVRERQDRVMVALAQMFATRPFTPETPYLPQFLETYRRVYPAESAELLDVLLDLSHGVFVDPGAAALWRRHYLAAVHADEGGLDLEAIDAARARWRAAALRDPGVLYSRVGPQLRCEVRGRTVRLGALDSEATLSLDVNTAEEGVMRLIPGITEGEVASWLAERARAPFADAADFKTRAGLSEKALASLMF